MHRERRLGLLLLGGGCLPFAVGALVGEDGQGLPECPLRAATGLPCPLCGATRAFALAARGDGRFWQFNATWVALAAAAVLACAFALAASARGAAPLSRAGEALAVRLVTPGRIAAATLLAVAVPWAYALAAIG
jgi:Protein of unknown function (DUF2752)